MIPLSLGAGKYEIFHQYAQVLSGKRQETERELILRNEKATDITAINEVTIAAFKNHPISNHTEPFIIHALGAADALTISLVAEIEGQIVGHIAFSPVTVSDVATGWYGLGPVSVSPDHQRQGIGNVLL